MQTTHFCNWSSTFFDLEIQSTQIHSAYIRMTRRQCVWVCMCLKPCCQNKKLPRTSQKHLLLQRIRTSKFMCVAGRIMQACTPLFYTTHTFKTHYLLPIYLFKPYTHTLPPPHYCHQIIYREQRFNTTSVIILQVKIYQKNNKLIHIQTVI